MSAPLKLPAVRVPSKERTAAQLSAAAQLSSELAAAEQEMKRRFTRAVKTRNERVTKTALAGALADRISGAAKLRAQLDEFSCRDVTRKLAHVTPATDSEITMLSQRFNMSLAGLFPEARGFMWFRLFALLDPDCSGRVSFYEFCDGVRNILKEAVSNARLEALWRKLDEDGSGFIMAGEFSKFMRLGYDAMLEEQERIKGMRTRPVWTAVGKIYEEKPNFKEIQAERLRKMHESLRSNILRLESQSAKLEAEAAQAEAELRRLAGRGVASPRSGALSSRGGPPSPRSGALSPRAGALSPRSATASGPAKLS
jgi:hypothetical protein